MENSIEKVKISNKYTEILDPQVYEFYREKIEKRAFFDPSIPLDVLRKGADSVFNDKNPVCDIAEWEEKVLSFRETVVGSPRCVLKPEYRGCEHFAHPVLGTVAPDLRVRIYWPKAKAECEGLPLVLYFHGGGFVLHNVESHDSLARFIANEWNAVVISADYRLAPEHPYPGFLQDAWSLLWWGKDHALSLGADPGKVVLAGDSAGASIAAAISRLAAMCDIQSASDEEATCQSAISDKRSACRAAGAEAPAQPAVWAQVLLYGAYGCVPDSASESVAEFGGGDFVLPKAMIDSFAGYVTEAPPAPEDVLFAPGRGTQPDGMPRTVVVTAGCDPLRDDGRGYAAALKAQGADAIYIEAAGLMHGFALYFHKFDRAAEVIRKAGSFVFP